MSMGQGFLGLGTTGRPAGGMQLSIRTKRPFNSMPEPKRMGLLFENRQKIDKSTIIAFTGRYSMLNGILNQPAETGRIMARGTLGVVSEIDEYLEGVLIKYDANMNEVAGFFDDKSEITPVPRYDHKNPVSYESRVHRHLTTPEHGSCYNRNQQFLLGMEQAAAITEGQKRELHQIKEQYKMLEELRKNIEHYNFDTLQAMCGIMGFVEGEIDEDKELTPDEFYHVNAHVRAALSVARAASIIVGGCDLEKDNDGKAINPTGIVVSASQHAEHKAIVASRKRANRIISNTNNIYTNEKIWVNNLHKLQMAAIALGMVVDAKNQDELNALHTGMGPMTLAMHKKEQRIVAGVDYSITQRKKRKDFEEMTILLFENSYKDLTRAHMLLFLELKREGWQFVPKHYRKGWVFGDYAGRS